MTGARTARSGHERRDKVTRLTPLCSSGAKAQKCSGDGGHCIVALVNYVFQPRGSRKENGAETQFGPHFESEIPHCISEVLPAYLRKTFNGRGVRPMHLT